MFGAHPELLNIFNHTNQKQRKQQKALARAVYAKYIDNLCAILPVVNQIAHKHRSLGIKPEHYPIIVGKLLLLAIKDLLGYAATDAYKEIADTIINLEAELYKQASNQNGGWDGF